MKEVPRRDIDIALLRAFIAVIETGGMTSAAKSLNLTQAAVSQQIKRLEELFGKQLFNRDLKQLRLTAVGERLGGYARRMMSLNEETWNAIVAPDFEGEIALGCPHDIIGVFMPTILRSFSRAWPKIRITLHSDSTPILLEKLSNGEIDLTLTTEQGIFGEMLLADSLVWVGMPGGAAHRNSPIPVALGSETCAFRAAAVEALSQAGRDWNLMCQVGSLEPVIASLEADLAVAPFLAMTVPSQLESISSGSHLPKLPTFYINLHQPEFSSSAIVEELARHIRTGFSEQLKNAA